MRCKICQRVVRYPADSSKVDQMCGKCKKDKTENEKSLVNNILLSLVLSRLAEKSVYLFSENYEYATVFKGGKI